MPRYYSVYGLLCFAVATLWIVPSEACAGDYTEIGDGDLSGNRLAPTSWKLAIGTNRLIVTTSPNDEEYVRVSIPAGLRFGSLVVQFYTTADKMFIGVQQGATFTVAPELATEADMFGYTHFGTTAANVGTDILDDMGAGQGAIGFVPPLASGSYTFWLQQGSPGVSTTYQLNFGVLGPQADYNGDGKVDAADYTVWRNTAGSTSDFRADGTGPSGTPDHVIDRLDYNFWKQHFSEGAGSGFGNATQVPEPAGALLCLVAAAGLGVPGRQRSLGARAREKRERRTC